MKARLARYGNVPAGEFETMLYDDAIALDAELRALVRAEFEAHAFVAQIGAVGALARAGAR